MPKKSNDEEEKKVTKKETKTATKKAGTKVATKESTKKAVSKSTAKVASSKTTKKTPAKKDTKKETTKATTQKSTKQTSGSTSKKRATKRVSKKVAVQPEYYDLPNFYNKTIVKILAQTPSCLFVYWEISEEDGLKFQDQYGSGFFQDTKPYLVISNETMNYSFEVEINDYANSWYVHINDSNCKYAVKLIRKPINNNVPINAPSVYISSSNEMDAPNDHILFDKLGKTVFFKNVKTNAVSQKDIATLSFIRNIGGIYNIYDLYKQIYKNEINGNELETKLSSSQSSSFFK